MAKKTSIHICAAKYGAEKHNRREKEMKHVHPEYSHLNKSWEAEDFKSVADEIRKAKERYSCHHFCRKAKLDENGKQLTMPSYDKKSGNPVVDPTSGLPKLVPVWEQDLSKPKKMPKNAEPIREGVAVITETTTMDQEGHEHLVTDKDHQQGKYLNSAEGSTIFLWNHHAHYVFDWTDHKSGQCINLNRHDMSELQDMLANTLKMERGKKSDKKWRDAHSYKAEQEAIRAKEVAEYTERKKAESKQIIETIKENSNKLTKLQKALDDLLSATSVPEESLNAVPFAEMTFTMKGSDKVKTVQDLIDDAIRLINEDISTPIPLLKRDEWQKERNAKAKEIVTNLQQQLLSVSKLHKKRINNVGKQMYLDAKQKVAHAAKTEEENVRLKQRISQLDENAIAREKARTATAERKAQEQMARADREEQRANNAESRLSMMERFVRQVGASEAFTHWSLLTTMVDKAINAFNAWAHNTASVFSRNDERVIGQGIIAKCQLEGLNPVSDTEFMWDTAVLRIGQLASEMNVSMGGQSVGGSNGNVDELTNWNGTKKRGQGI